VHSSTSTRMSPHAAVYAGPIFIPLSPSPPSDRPDVPRASWNIHNLLRAPPPVPYTDVTRQSRWKRTRPPNQRCALPYRNPILVFPLLFRDLAVDRRHRVTRIRPIGFQRAPTPVRVRNGIVKCVFIGLMVVQIITKCERCYTVEQLLQRRSRDREEGVWRAPAGTIFSRTVYITKRCKQCDSYLMLWMLLLMDIVL